MRLLVFGLLASAVLASSAMAAEVSTATCDADLAAVDASFAETQARLDKAASADTAEKCAAIRHHIAVMVHGVDVFRRCLPKGHDKGENIGQLAGSIADFVGINKSLGCPPIDPSTIDGTE